MSFTSTVFLMSLILGVIYFAVSKGKARTASDNFVYSAGVLLDAKNMNVTQLEPDWQTPGKWIFENPRTGYMEVKRKKRMLDRGPDTIPLMGEYITDTRNPSLHWVIMNYEFWNEKSAKLVYEMRNNLNYWQNKAAHYENLYNKLQEHTDQVITDRMKQSKELLPVFNVPKKK